MAPSSNSAKALQQNRPRPAVPRAIIPAIPLPYVQKRQQQEAARVKAKEEAAAAAAVVTPVVETPSSPSPPASETTPAVVNGSAEEHTSDVSETSIKTEEVHEPTSPTTPATPATPAVEKENIDVEEHEDQEEAQELQETPRSAPSESQSSASRSTYHMPPPFVPASQSHINANGSDPVKLPSQHTFNGQHPMHHPHPSSGSVMFGTYPESNNSSPAPPPSAGNPPYSYHQPPQHGAARHGPHQSNGSHSQHLSNGYSPMHPPAPPGYYPRPDGFMNQGPGTDFARRQMASYGPPDGYSPSATPMIVDSQSIPFNPATPHSFHGSQSSATNEQESGPPFYSQYPTAVISNGSNGHIDEVRLYQQPRPKPRPGSQPTTQVAGAYLGQPVGPPQPPVDHLDGLVQYIQSQFADASLADYTLELRYSDDRALPVRIPGHNLMFARSPTLKNLMEAQVRDSNTDGYTVRTLLIESDDRFLRSDAFWMAAQRLYGGSLLDFGSLAVMNSMPNSPWIANMPGTPNDRFDLALGYAAAGQILQIPPVISRGAEIASHFVNWSTIEKALDFALDGGLDSSWTLNSQREQEKPPSTYGPAVHMLINSSLNFIITAFPAGFKLETAAGEPLQNARLPFVQDARSTVQNPRLSSIKFGDHPSEESVRSTSPTSTATTLSKILLNLPFHLLKYVLESSRLGNVLGWATTVLRQEVMHSVIEEREKRRKRVHASTYISNTEREANSKEWEAVGWQEAVESGSGNEATPILTRTWVGFTTASPDI